MRRDLSTPALAALATLLASASLATVVDGYDWLRLVLLVVTVVALSGVGLRRVTSSRAMVLGGQGVLGVALVTWLFAREEAIGGVLPGPAAWARLAAVWADGGDTIVRYTAPAPSLRGLLLLITVGILVVAVAVDALTSTTRMPAAAGLPLLAVYCVPAAVVTGGLPGGYFLAGAAGWLVLLAHDARDRIGGWGKVLPRWTGSGPAPASEQAGALAAAGRRLGVGALLLAIALPPLVPDLPEVGLGRRGLPGAGSGLGDLAVVNPILTLRDNLQRQRDFEVLRYTTDQRDVAPLRIVTADTFDGESWSPSTAAVTRRQRASNGLPDPPGLAAQVSRTAYRMGVSVSNLDQDFLPLPYPTRRVRVEGDWYYDARSLNVVGDGETTRGLDYTVDYLAVRPTSTQLQRAGLVPEAVRERYTDLPRSLPVEVGDIARRVTRNAGSDFERAVILQQWFRDTGGFLYSTDAPAGGGTDAVLAFLREKQGYCVQFSSAMAVMARSLGIPARIGVGFLPGTPVGGGAWSVKLTDAHAWPELYFQGVGWVRFEPTPSTRAGAPPSWAQPSALTAPTGPADGADSANPRREDTLDSKQRQLEERESAQSTPKPTPSTPQATDDRVIPDLPWTSLGWGVLLLGALLLTPVSAWLGRRRRRHSVRSEPDLAEALWADLHERLDDLGLVVPGGSTPRQTDVRIAGAGELQGASREALRRLTRYVEDVRYAPPATRAAGTTTLDSGTQADASTSSVRPGATDAGLDQDVDTVVRAVAQSRTRAERVTALVVPRSGRRRVSEALRRATGLVADTDRAVARTVGRAAHWSRAAVRRRVPRR